MKLTIEDHGRIYNRFMFKHATGWWTDAENVVWYGRNPQPRRGIGPFFSGIERI